MERDIVIITNDEILVTPRYLENTLGILSRRVSLVAIAPLHESKGLMETVKKYWSSYGSGFVFSLGWRTVIRKLGIAAGLIKSSVKICRNFDVPCETLSDVNTDDTIGKICRYGEFSGRFLSDCP